MKYNLSEQLMTRIFRQSHHRESHKLFRSIKLTCTVGLYLLPFVIVSGIQVFLRGRAHVEWRVTRGGERRTVKEDQYFVDETVSVWGLKGMQSTDEQRVN